MFEDYVAQHNIQTHGFRHGYERKGVFPVHAVLAHLGETLEIGGDIMRVVSLRYFAFDKDECACTRCGLKGTYFAKERGARFRKAKGVWEPLNERYHFNLYAIDAEGREALPTNGPRPPQVEGRQVHAGEPPDHVPSAATLLL